MDSFLSLFDPSDGTQKSVKRKPEQDTVKKKGETAKGRRRGRRCQGKSETLPEESSFLCEPQLSTELLVKDGSYIENYIELKRDSESKADSDKKPKRRNSGRKNRRKKKISPAKDLISTTSWYQDTDAPEPSWNNQSQFKNEETGKNIKENVGKNINESIVRNIGKNVNDLKNIKTCKRKDFGNFKSFEEREVYNVIDKLEKVGLKDDMYLAGDFNTAEFENDFLYSSDDMDEFVDDTTSEPDDSGDEAYGSLPPEPRFGNVEYKLQLVAPCERRFQHLVTQLKWRLRSGGGSAVYVVGVRDCGALRGLRARSLRASLRTLRRMAAALHAHVAHVSARRVAPHRAVAEVYVRKLADARQSVELRVAVLGANEAGKSTLIGVLTQGELDNGRGSARLNMFRHLHEVKSGRTSSLSHEILGFDAQGNVVNYGCSELMTAERIGERSAKLVSFLDLAGHSKYQRTTLHGLTGYCPHYAMLVISATAGITLITEEHMSLLLALDVRLCVVLSKRELAPNSVPALVAQLDRLLATAGKKCLLITDENLARSCVAPQKLLLDTIDNATANDTQTMNEEPSMQSIPVFPVSSVRGHGLNALHAYLLALQPPPDHVQPAADHETCEFQIDEIFHVGDTSGPVVGGLLARGRLYEGDELIIGPLDTGEFVEISVKTIYRNRVPHGSVRAGQSASLGLSMQPPVLRPGMVLLTRPVDVDGERPLFGGCAPGTCRRMEVTELLQNRKNHENSKNRKNVRRKNKNLLEDIAKVENSLTKKDCLETNNIYKSDSDEKDTKRDITTLQTNETTVKSLQNDINILQTKETTMKLLQNDIKSLENGNIYKSDSDIEKETTIKTLQSDIQLLQTDIKSLESDIKNLENIRKIQTSGKNEELTSDEEQCTCADAVYLEDPRNPRGCIYFQASVRVLRHSTAIYPGFQCTVHVGNVRQTAIIEGILSVGSELRAGESASVVFRFARCPEYLVRGRRMLFTAGLGTRAIGRVTQVFPYFP